MQDNVIKILKNGGAGILATDTLYGLVGQAHNQKTVQRIYILKKRRPDKPFIILINALSDLDLFGIKLNERTKEIISGHWPGPVSIILDCPDEKFEYLHRGTGGLAFRLPAKKSLRELITKTGPLVAPSANPESKKPARSIKEARNYFGNNVDFYKSGQVTDKSSKVIKIENGKIELIRD